jgi:iron complex transport system ATP-binding protein
MRLLAELGFEVTVGILHAGDTDEAVAERLNLQRVTVPPFSAIDDRTAADCRRLMAAASLVVVCDPPVGPGNAVNLDLALEAARSGVRTLLLEQIPIEERDFLGGHATAMWGALRELAITVNGVEALADVLAAEPGAR